MPTLILPPTVNRDSYALAEEARELGWEILPAPHWRLPPSLVQNFLNTEIVIYADPLFGDIAASAFQVALLEPALDWLTTLPQALRQREIRYLPLGGAKTLPGPLFVKPAEDKCFPAKVYAHSADLNAYDMITDDTLVLVSEPVAWEVEYRFFLRERAIAASSAYFREGQLIADSRFPEDYTSPEAEHDEARQFIQTLLAEASVDLPPAVVVDVGKIAGKGWAVVEANPAWGSGLYGCMPESVLPVLQRACVPRQRLSDSDAVYARREVAVEG